MSTKSVGELSILLSISVLFFMNFGYSETIGDGYLVASGLPNRNGDKHVDEIAKMSFSFMNSICMFRIDHLPKERVNLRIGFHTGEI